MGNFDPPSLLRSLFERSVETADPMRIVPAHLPERPAGRVIVVGAGKASARMAEALESVWGPCEGLVITRYGHARPCQGIEIIEASHPVPDASGLAATRRMLDLVSGLGETDHVIALMSGGASALLVQPAEGVTLAQKQAVNQSLLSCGAPIAEINCIRKHLSRVKGGRLAAAAYPASLLCLMISDVPGDDPALIGSGPTVGDLSTPADALAIARRWNIPLPPSVVDALSGANSVIAPADYRLKTTVNRVIAAPAHSLEAAAALGRGLGLEVQILGDRIEGEAREVAKSQAGLAKSIQHRLKPSDPPVLLLSGGELTVTRRGTGSGGPNAEFSLACAIALDGQDGIHVLSCDTDGVDGAAEVAGAVTGPETLARAEALGLVPQDYLDRNDSHTFFGKLGLQVVTGPTLTNVNDFRAFLIQPRKES